MRLRLWVLSCLLGPGAAHAQEVEEAAAADTTAAAATLPTSKYYIYQALLPSVDGGPQVAVSRGTYIVNFGSRDGVKPGSIFQIYRQELFLGLARVQRSFRDSSEIGLLNLELKADKDDPLPFGRGDRLYPEYVLLETVHFASGRPVFTPEMHENMRYAARLILSFPDYPVVLEGHTDNFGEPEENIVLGKARAAEIGRFLNEVHLIPWSQMHTVGYADQRPIASNASPEGRARNRRVDIVLVDELEAGAR